MSTPHSNKRRAAQPVSGSARKKRNTTKASASPELDSSLAPGLRSPAPDDTHRTALLASKLDSMTPTIRLANRIIDSMRSRATIMEIVRLKPSTEANSIPIERFVKLFNNVKESMPDIATLDRDQKGEIALSSYLPGETGKVSPILVTLDRDLNKSVHSTAEHPHAVLDTKTGGIHLAVEAYDHLLRAIKNEDASVLHCVQFHLAVVLAHEAVRSLLDLVLVKRKARSKGNTRLASSKAGALNDVGFSPAEVWELVVLGGFLYGRIDSGDLNGERENLISDLTLARWSDGINVPVDFNRFESLTKDESDVDLCLPLCEQDAASERTFAYAPKLFDITLGDLAYHRRFREHDLRIIAVPQILPQSVTWNDRGGRASTGVKT